MQIKDIFNKIITNIYCRHIYENGGLNQAYCYIELDNEIIIAFPSFPDCNILVEKIDPDAKTIFPKPKKHFLSFLFKNDTKDTVIRFQKIIDFIYYDNGLTDKGFFELENGGIISETNFSMQGIGGEGLNYYQGIQDLETRFGPEFKKLSDEKGSH